MVTPESPPYSPSEKWPIIEEGDLPELDKEFTKSLKALGKTDAQIAHVNDEGTWEVGKLHKYKPKDTPAPTGGTAGTPHLHKFKNATRDQFFRLRLNQYGPTKHWVALKVKPSPASTAAKAAKKAKSKAKPKPKSGGGRN